MVDGDLVLAFQVDQEHPEPLPRLTCLPRREVQQDGGVLPGGVRDVHPLERRERPREAFLGGGADVSLRIALGHRTVPPCIRWPPCRRPCRAGLRLVSEPPPRARGVLGCGAVAVAARRLPDPRPPAARQAQVVAGGGGPRADHLPGRLGEPVRVGQQPDGILDHAGAERYPVLVQPGGVVPPVIPRTRRQGRHLRLPPMLSRSHGQRTRPRGRRSATGGGSRRGPCLDSCRSSRLTVPALQLKHDVGHLHDLMLPAARLWRIVAAIRSDRSSVSARIFTSGRNPWRLAATSGYSVPTRCRWNPSTTSRPSPSA